MAGRTRGFRFDAFYHFPLSLSLCFLFFLLPAGHPLDNLSVCRYVQRCATSDSTRRKGFLFFVFLPSLSLPFPSSFFSSRVEIRDRCLTFSRIPSGTKSSGNSNSRGGIELRRIREFEKRNCARVVEIVESVTIKIFINTNGYIERNY